MAVEGRSRWPDERIDDRFANQDERLADLSHEVHALRNLPNAVSELAIEVREARSDVDQGFLSIRDLSEKFDSHVTERRNRDEADRIERKSDRRWVIGAVFTAAGLIIAAVSLLAGSL